jgi:hypothetical protein
MHRFYQQEARPVVLLLGWLGSKTQHVQKYRLMWEVGGEHGRQPPHSPTAALGQ